MTSAAASQVGDWSHLEARLSSRFSRLHPDDVRRCVRDSMAQFADARIRTYLAVLVERAATDRLRVLERAIADRCLVRGRQSPDPSNLSCVR